MSSLFRWILFTLAVIGALTVGVLAGSFSAHALGVSEFPVTGFFAALAVVVTAAFAAPTHRIAATVSVFATGALAAWWLLEPSWFPESYPDRAYQPTHIPLVVTYLGGVLGLAVAAFRSRLTSRA
jgi:hypothetical protein